MAKFRNVTSEKLGAIYGLIPPGRWVEPDGTIIIPAPYDESYRGQPDIWAEELDTTAPAAPATPVPEEATP